MVISMENIKAKDLMRKRVLTLHPSDKMQRVKDIFDQYSIRHIPVMVSRQVVGILSKSDLLKIEGLSRDSFDAFLTEQIMKTHTVDQYMTRDVVCCDQETPMGKIVDLFLQNEIHSLLVIENNELVGIITPQDILRIVKGCLVD